MWQSTESPSRIQLMCRRGEQSLGSGLPEISVGSLAPCVESPSIPAVSWSRCMRSSRVRADSLSRNADCLIRRPVLFDCFICHSLAADAGGEREFGGGGVGLLNAGMDEGAGSGRCRVEASAKSKFELSNS